MSDVHLCLSDLIDQDLSAYEYYQSLPDSVRSRLADKEIRTFDELQENAARIQASSPHR